MNQSRTDRIESPVGLLRTGELPEVDGTDTARDFGDLGQVTRSSNAAHRVVGGGGAPSQSGP